MVQILIEIHSVLCPVLTVIHRVQILKEIVALSVSTNDGYTNGTNTYRDLFLAVPSFSSYTHGQILKDIVTLSVSTNNGYTNSTITNRFLFLAMHSYDRYKQQCTHTK